MLRNTVAGLALAAATMTGTAQAENLVMQSLYASSLPGLGDKGLELTERVKLASGGDLTIEFNEPGAIVGGGEIWDAVSTGALDAGWFSPGFAEGYIPAAPIFSAVPFGPSAKEYTAWWYYGGGKELWAEISADYNIHTELCTVLPPEASGWFREPITDLAQIEGKKMRIFGLGAQVLSKLGVEAQSMSPGDAITALRLGTIDLAEIAYPSIDASLGMQEHAKYYYFPGWHQQASLITLIVNKDRWDSLSDQHRALIEEACAANVTRSIAEGEASQVAPLQDLVAKGVEVKRWPDDILAQFRTTWNEIAEEKSNTDPDFAKAWESLSSFREEYATWNDLSGLQ